MELSKGIPQSNVRGVMNDSASWLCCETNSSRNILQLIYSSHDRDWSECRGRWCNESRVSLSHVSSQVSSIWSQPWRALSGGTCAGEKSRNVVAVSSGIWRICFCPASAAMSSPASRRMPLPQRFILCSLPFRLQLLDSLFSLWLESAGESAFVGSNSRNYAFVLASVMIDELDWWPRVFSGPSCLLWCRGVSEGDRGPVKWVNVLLPLNGQEADLPVLCFLSGLFLPDSFGFRCVGCVKVWILSFLFYRSITRGVNSPVEDTCTLWQIVRRKLCLLDAFCTLHFSLWNLQSYTLLNNIPHLVEEIHSRTKLAR